MRLARHLFTIATTASPGKEVRVARMGPRLVEERRVAWERWYREVARARGWSAFWNTLAWGTFSLGYLATVAFVVFRLKVSPGDVILVLAAGSRLSAYLGGTVGEIGFLRGFWMDGARRMAWLEDFAASKREQCDQSVPQALERGIQLDRVSFAYPGTDRLVLEEVSATLRPGSVVAIVGENGAGKSTLIKLLCRYYEPTAGSITVDGTALSRFPAEDWRARLAGAFQDFSRYEFQAKTTIGVGDLARMADDQALATAVERAGAGTVVTQLPKGLDTQLGPTWPEGLELSFGQWQKLALARGLLRPTPILLLLDEPTAALDAESEHALFERFAIAARAPKTGASRGDRDGGRGQITILVSHRFSTVRMADQILVLDGARLIESGSHESLMKQGGKYAELYRIQASAYLS